ncbi:MAG: OmpA family protein [Cytophagales bacterium]|jgi:outer membrane protein OmpA-like peptidoglycan-associated protein/Tol biopolymer transport system component|nr:OmpA family protein [Cytophagales bacterium]MCA6389236.1 OmpA family protein [Cytophagales bacterium]MCA6393486.1 OmpA family protein [Cytophagales bacterium]MCA6395926.1 OmpA family protein [Cytophagales bacterium]MCA6399475.1 OmpA family protein [Cytophagales bacterium]
MIYRLLCLAFVLCGVSLSTAQVKPPTATTSPAPVDSMVYYGNTKKPAISDPIQIEYAPTIQADGRVIIFEAQSKRSYQLFQTRISDGKWQKPESITRINESGDSTALIGGPSLSFDGNELYFFKDATGNSEILFSTRQKDGWSKPELIGSPINSAGYEGFPSISADGSTLYFVRQNFEGPTSKELKKEAQFCLGIYKSVRDKSGKWGTPEKLPWPINQDCEKAPKIMADGRTLIFSSNRPGGKGGYDMYQSKLNDLGEWGMPESLAFVNTDKDDQLPCISAEGDLMYYTYNNNDIYSVVIPPKLRQFMNNIVQGYITDEDTKKGIGAEIVVTDAFTSEVVLRTESNSDDGRYTVVLPVGRSFNFEFRKPDYSSYTYSLDIRSKKKYEEITLNIKLFKTVRLSINVSDHEFFEPLLAEVTIQEKGQDNFIVDKKTNALNGRLTVDLPLGKEYLIVVKAPYFKREAIPFNISSLVIYRDFEKFIELVPEKVEVALNVADMVNNSKVKSKVLLKNKTRGEVIEVDGNQMVSLRAGDRYEVEVTSDQGYAFNSTAIDLTTGKVNSIDVKLMKLELNAQLALKDINFESNSDKLSDGSFIELTRVITLMKENPTLKVEIDAHTDDIGSDNYNLILSNKRAKSVMEYLTQNNIPVERFSAKGYGETQAKFKNDSDENRAKNRRVELKILSI